MIFSEKSPIQFQDPLPAQVDVVIIGAGIIGISTAWFLSKSGVSVLVCEKGRVAGEQSSRNWGWVRQQSRDAAELPIVIDSVNTWAGLSKDTGEDLGFTREGVLYLADNDEQLTQYERWLDVAKQHQLDTRILSSTEVDKLISDNPGHWHGGMYTASDGRAEPFKAVPGIARAVQRVGGVIRENCAVRTIDLEAGRVSGVVTESGRIRASSVVCAAGAWSSLFAGNLDIKLPQLTVRGTVARTAPAPDFFAGNAYSNNISFRRRMDGGYTVSSSGLNEHFVGADSFRYFFPFLPSLFASTKYLRLRFGNGSGVGLMKRLTPTRKWHADDISPFERSRVLNPPPSQTAIRQIHEQMRLHLPSLAGIALQEAWAGMIDVLPDVVPVMDEVEAYPGLFLATGFSGHGFGIGPGAGRVMADMVMGRPAVHDLTRFRLSRFTDGSKIIPGPGL